MTSKYVEYIIPVMKKIILAASLFSLLALTGCASSPPNKAAWEHYDACSTENQSFREIVKCGKAKRNEYCKSANDCGAEGNAFVLYADTLAQAVERREMTETDAKLKWIAYRNSRSDAYRQAAQAEEARTTAAISSINAVNAINRPRSCYTTGGVTNCY